MQHHHLRVAGLQAVALAKVTDPVETTGGEGVVDAVFEGVPETATLPQDLTQGRTGDVLCSLVGGETTDAADGAQIHGHLAGDGVGLGLQELVEVAGGQAADHGGNGHLFEVVAAEGVTQRLAKVAFVVDQVDGCGTGEATCCTNPRAGYDGSCARTTERARRRHAADSGRGDGHGQLSGRTHARVAVFKGVVNFLHLAPIHIPTRFGILQPRQVRIGLHHRIDGLADGLLIDMLEIDIQPFHSFGHVAGELFGQQQETTGSEMAAAIGGH
ncbi:hypothetical protein D3C77_302480 [compost metagenome]